MDAFDVVVALHCLHLLSSDKKKSLVQFDIVFFFFSF